jgi:hypothetical protein
MTASNKTKSHTFPVTKQKIKLIPLQTKEFNWENIFEKNIHSYIFHFLLLTQCQVILTEVHGSNVLLPWLAHSGAGPPPRYCAGARSNTQQRGCLSSYVDVATRGLHCGCTLAPFRTDCSFYVPSP